MNFNILIELIGYASLGHILVDFMQNLNLKELNTKPFNCDMCFSTWYSVLPLTICYGLKGILYSAIVGVLADIIFKLKQRL